MKTGVGTWEKGFGKREIGDSEDFRQDSERLGEGLTYLSKFPTFFEFSRLLRAGNSLIAHSLISLKSNERL